MTQEERWLSKLGCPMSGKMENMIIGMDVITKGDLSIKNCHGQTVYAKHEDNLNNKAIKP